MRAFLLTGRAGQAAQAAQAVMGPVEPAGPAARAAAGASSGNVVITQTGSGVIDTAGDGIRVEAVGEIDITNAGDIFGGTAGIFAQSDVDIDIINSAGGLIDTDTGFAIDTVGAGTTVTSAGTIIGAVDLTDNDDLMAIPPAAPGMPGHSTSDFRLGAEYGDQCRDDPGRWRHDLQQSGDLQPITPAARWCMTGGLF